MSYTILIPKPVQKQLDALDWQVARRIATKLESLKTNPRPPDVKKLRDTDDWRVRVGDYRIVYNIEDAQLVVRLITIAHRRDVYR